MSKSKMNTKMRIYHRYLGFFLAGIMAIYSISGLILIFRETDFLKSEKTSQRKLPSDIKSEDIGKTLRIRDFKIAKEENGIVFFKQGRFDRKTGIADVTSKELPRMLQKLTEIHKASTKDRLFFLNIFFGVSLFFFVISAFWMFMPKTEIFKKGLYFTAAGVILTLILIFA